jgi:hypothetical protein
MVAAGTIDKLVEKLQCSNGAASALSRIPDILSVLDICEGSLLPNPLKRPTMPTTTTGSVPHKYRQEMVAYLSIWFEKLDNYDFKETMPMTAYAALADYLEARVRY